MPRWNPDGVVVLISTPVGKTQAEKGKAAKAVLTLYLDVFAQQRPAGFSCCFGVACRSVYTHEDTCDAPRLLRLVWTASKKKKERTTCCARSPTPHFCG